MPWNFEMAEELLAGQRQRQFRQQRRSSLDETAFTLWGKYFWSLGGQDVGQEQQG
jgi:hypothetical protein